MSLSGTVKLFNPHKGFGFITTSDGADIFLHIKSCAEGTVPVQGDVVQFDMSECPVKPGQMQANNVIGGTGVPAGKGGGKNAGQCKSFNDEKGFGFIVGADGSDIFFHIKGVTDGSQPQAGDHLNFDLEPSKMKPDQIQAQNITGGTGWGKGGKGDGGKGYGKAGKGGGYDDWGGKGGGGGGWGGDDWGSPYGGGKGKGKDGGKGCMPGKGGKMEAMMAMVKGMWGGGGGGDSWGGDDSWGGGGGKGGKGKGW